MPKPAGQMARNTAGNEIGGNDMPQLLKPDICVIGGGSGGLAAAMAAAACGVPVTLVEKGALGGRRLSAGLPALALFGAARRVFVPPFGHAVQSDIEAAVHDMARNVSKERLTGLGVQVIEGTARFADGATVVVGDACRIKARRFIIATGSRPAPLSAAPARARRRCRRA
jgi:pyruvate/2-oxoglutarate dehydrogenase complex dihydrolipoamide dehydrogenase (E3) component